jgi:hypothetical protein
VVGLGSSCVMRVALKWVETSEKKRMKEEDSEIAACRGDFWDSDSARSASGNATRSRGLKMLIRIVFINPNGIVIVLIRQC